MADEDNNKLVDLQEVKHDYKALLHDGNLDKLELELQKPNIFNILGISRMEIRHSNFLGWLFDPNGSHGLGNKFLVRILRDLSLDSDNHLEIININNLNFNNVDVYREYPISIKDIKKGFIDILIVFRDEKDKYVICVENKIDTTDTDKQLANYRKYIEDTFVGYKHFLVYLTPNGTNPKDTNEPKWKKYSYNDEIIEHLIHTQNSTTDSIIKTYISDYLSMLKSEIMGKQDEAQQLADTIYEKHKRIIDFVVANRDSNKEYQQIWEKDFPKVFKFAQTLLESIKDIYKTNKYELGYVKNAITVKQWTEGQNRFYNIYSIYARGNDSCNLEFTFSTKEDHNKIKEEVKKIVDNKNKADNNVDYTDSTFFTIFSVDKLEEPELREIHKIRFNVDSQ